MTGNSIVLCRLRAVAFRKYLILQTAGQLGNTGFGLIGRQKFLTGLRFDSAFSFFILKSLSARFIQFFAQK